MSEITKCNHNPYAHICSDCMTQNTITSLRAEVERLEGQIKMKPEDTHGLCDGGCAPDECVCVSRFAVQKINDLIKERDIEMLRAKRYRKAMLNALSYCNEFVNGHIYDIIIEAFNTEEK